MNPKNGSAVVIRRMRSDDIEAVFAAGSSQPAFAVSASMAGFWTKEQLLGLCRSREDVTLVAEVDKKLIGFTFFFCHHATRKATWENDWVHPEWRGQGISRRMTDMAFEVLRKQQYLSVVGYVKVDNAEALALFSRHGFTPGEKVIWLDRTI